MVTEEDKVCIQKCIDISTKSFTRGDHPFGSIITKEGEIIAQSLNNSRKDISEHAEMLALRKAVKIERSRDLSSCTLYSNCEPCPMCSFMIREYKIRKVVFAVPSPYMGGYSKWNILTDKQLAEVKPYFSTPPQVIGGVLAEEAQKVFKKAGLWMFG